MKKYIAPVAFALVLSAFAIFSPDKATAKLFSGSGEKYIIELKEKPSSVNSEKTDDELFNEQTPIIKSIQAFSTLDNKGNKPDRFTSVFNGFSMKLTADDLKYVKNFSSVKGVYKEKTHTIGSCSDEEIAESVATHENYSLKTMNRPDVQYPGKDVLVAVLDDGFFISQNGDGSVDYHEAYADNLSAEHINVEKYNEAYFTKKKSITGFIGKDAKRLNNKVPYYYDYGGGSGDDSSDDTDVFNASSSHGTHVSTSIAGKSSSYQGVVPYAQLSLMKVAKDGSGAADSDILEALDDSVKLGVDLITMSMGSDINDFASFSSEDSPMNSVLDTLTEAGIIFDVAAGNGGKQLFQNTDGYAYNVPSLSQTGITGGTANDDRVMSIANATNDTYVTSALEFNGMFYDYTDPSDSKSSGATVSMSTLKGKDLSYVLVPNNGEEADYDNIDVSGKVAVISRGDITFYQKIFNAQKKGAIAAVIYNNVTTDTNINMNLAGSGKETITIPSAFISRRALTDIVNGAASPFRVLIDTPISNYYKRRVSESSSDGSNSELGIKPEIATPGTYCTAGVIGVDKDGNRFSSYADYTGTSMAAPNFAGSLALLLSQGVEKDQLLMRTMSTAQVMKDKNGVSYSPRRQGAGLIDLTKALNTEQYLEGTDQRNLVSALQKKTLKKSKIELGYSLDGKFDLKFTVHNDSSAGVVYTPSVNVMIPKTVNTTEVKDVYGNVSTEEVDGTTYQTTLDKQLREFTGYAISVDGNSSKAVSIPLTLTDQEKEDIMKVFKNESKDIGTYVEGYVTLSPSNDQAVSLSIPYMGFYGDFTNSDLVEPFNFEKGAGQIYQSDLVNSFIKQLSSDSSLGLSPDYSSQWVVSGSNSSVEDVLTNKKSMSSLGTPIGYDISKGNVDYTNNEFYVGAPGSSEVMYLQQFVLGTVATNSVKIKNSSGNTIIDDHMFDALYSGSWNDKYDRETLNSYRLNRSLVSLDFTPNNSKYYVATRAYSIIPLYPFEKKTGTDGKETWERSGSYPDGTYTMTFDYTSEAAVSFGKTTVADPVSNQHMEYTLHLDSKAPTLDSMKMVSKGGQNYLRVYGSDETALMYFNVGGTYSNKIETDADNKLYADFNTSYFTSDKVNVTACDKAGNQLTKAIYLSDIADLDHTYSFNDTEAVISTVIDSSIYATLNSVVIDDMKKEYTVTLFKNDSQLNFTEAYRLVFRVGESSDTDVSLVNAFYIDKDGNLVPVKVTMLNGKITIEVPSGQYTKVVFVDFNSLSGLFDSTYELAGMGTIVTKIGTEYHYSGD